MHPTLRLLEDLRVARMVFDDACESYAHMDRVGELARQFNAAWGALLGEPVRWRARSRLANHVHITIYRTDGDQRLRRMHCRRRIEKALRERIPDIDLRAGTVMRIVLDSEVEQTLRAEGYYAAAAQWWTNPTAMPYLVPYTDVGIDVIENAIRDAVNSQTGIVPGSAVVNAIRDINGVLKVNYTARTAGVIDSITIVGNVDL